MGSATVRCLREPSAPWWALRAPRWALRAPYWALQAPRWALWPCGGHGALRASPSWSLVAAVEEDSTPTDRGVVTARVREEHLDAAGLLRALVEAGVEVSAFAKVRSDLEDVYESLGRDGVS